MCASAAGQEVRRAEITPERRAGEQMEGAENRRSSMKKNKVTQNYYKFLVLTKSKSDFLEILKIILTPPSKTKRNQDDRKKKNSTIIHCVLKNNGSTKNKIK
jgi:hypothetical protein